MCSVLISMASVDRNLRQHVASHLSGTVAIRQYRLRTFAFPIGINA